MRIKSQKDFFAGLLYVVIGGGFAIVPALRRYTPLLMHSIVATSLLVIALVGGGGIAFRERLGEIDETLVVGAGERDGGQVAPAAGSSHGVLDEMTGHRRSAGRR